MKGRINSFQSLGAVDGPGLRYVIFMQGCPLRCAYCHNPDTWDFDGGEEYEARAVSQKVLRYRSYFGESGGVTVSGGEPLMQWAFVAELFRLLSAEGVHTALDTSGFGNLNGAREVLKNTSLALCDIKFANDEDYRRYSDGNLSGVTGFLKAAEDMRVPVWIRHVVVPGITDSDDYIKRIAETAAAFSNIERLQLLPFRKFCSVKYENLGIPFPLSDYEECTETEISRLYTVIAKSSILPGVILE